MGKDAGSVVADPQLQQPSGPDYWLLQPSSPAFKAGFVAIDVSQVRKGSGGCRAMHASR